MFIMNDFYGRIDSLVDGLNLPQKCFESSCEVCDVIVAQENFMHSFYSFGGGDALVATSVFIGAKQERCPVPAQVIIDFMRVDPVFEVSNRLTGVKLNGLGRRFRRELDEPVFLTASDYVEFYSGRMDFPVRQSELKSVLDVSDFSVRETYKLFVEGLTGLDTSYKSLSDVDVTAAGFGFHGGDVEGFALHLLERAEEEDLDVLSKSPQVLAASVLYISGRLLG